MQLRRRNAGRLRANSRADRFWHMGDFGKPERQGFEIEPRAAHKNRQPSLAAYHLENARHIRQPKSGRIIHRAINMAITDGAAPSPLP